MVARGPGRSLPHGRRREDQTGDPAELQARIDWVLSDGDPWTDLEEEPPCFCEALLTHDDFQAVRAQLIRALPELRPVRQSASPPYVEFRWPEESFAWADWLARPESFRGAGEIRLGEDFVEIWTPTRSRMRSVLSSLLGLSQARVEPRRLEVDDPLASMAAALESGPAEDLNPDVDPDSLEFLMGGGDPSAWDLEVDPEEDPQQPPEPLW